jgi:hypothetical protein
MTKNVKKVILLRETFEKIVQVDSFTHNGEDYNLTKLKKIMVDIVPIQFDLKKLTWIFQYDTPREERILTADITNPILITNSEGRWVVLDGLHRLYKANSLGFKTIPTKIVTNYELSKTLL